MKTAKPYRVIMLDGSAFEFDAIVEANTLRIVGEVKVTRPLYCTRCRVGFTHDGQPMYALLFEQVGFLVCSKCGGSYGPAP